MLFLELVPPGVYSQSGLEPGRRQMRLRRGASRAVEGGNPDAVRRPATARYFVRSAGGGRRPLYPPTPWAWLGPGPLARTNPLSMDSDAPCATSEFISTGNAG